MSKVSVSQFIAASPESVWQHVGDPSQLASWHPAIAASPLSEDGRARTCTLADGGEVREVITARDDAARRYAYRIVESPLPMTDYEAALSVRAADGGAEIVWESVFQPAGIEPAQLEDMIRGLYAAGLDSLKAKLEG